MAGNGARVGDVAPDFKLPGSDDSVFCLSEELRARPYMLLFYPSDFGMVCSLEMRAFMDMRQDLEAMGIEAVGISRNSVLTHKQWKESLGIGFRLLSDEDGAVCEMYAGLQDSGLLKGLPRRAVFIVDRRRSIRYAWVSKTEGLLPPFDEIGGSARSLDL